MISGTTNFTLHGKGAELIAENYTLNINVLSNTNFSMVGPMILDADPFGFNQARAYFCTDLLVKDSQLTLHTAQLFDWKKDC